MLPNFSSITCLSTNSNLECHLKFEWVVLRLEGSSLSSLLCLTTLHPNSPFFSLVHFLTDFTFTFEGFPSNFVILGPSHSNCSWLSLSNSSAGLSRLKDCLLSWGGCGLFSFWLNVNYIFAASPFRLHCILLHHHCVESELHLQFISIASLFFLNASSLNHHCITYFVSIRSPLHLRCISNAFYCIHICISYESSLHSIYLYLYLY